MLHHGQSGRISQYIDMRVLRDAHIRANAMGGDKSGAYGDFITPVLSSGFTKAGEAEGELARSVL